MAAVTPADEPVHRAIRDAFAYVEGLGRFEDDRSYRKSHQALVGLFRDHVRLDCDDTVLAGALAVYGWMPRMMTYLDWEGLNSARDTVQRLRDCTTCNEARRVLTAMDARGQEQLLRFVNRSVIGTSKFLHFLNPVSIPVWDKRVARCFGYKHGPQINRVDRFLRYLEIMDAAIGAGVRVPENFQRFLNEEAPEPVSAIRALEFAMFLHGGKFADDAITP